MSSSWLPAPYKTARELELFNGRRNVNGRGLGQNIGWDDVLDLAVAAYWRKRVTW